MRLLIFQIDHGPGQLEILKYLPVLAWKYKSLFTLSYIHLAVYLLFLFLFDQKTTVHSLAY